MTLKQLEAFYWAATCASFAVAAERLAGARVPDRFEAMPQTFFERVASGYAARAAAEPARFARIAADRPRDEVARQVHEAFVARGWLPAVVA